MKLKLKNYRGNAHPFLCAVFRAGDSEAVNPILDSVSSRGFRLCVSQKKNIIAKSAAVLLFISASSEGDKRLTDAVTAASEMKKPIITIYLEKTELSPGFSLLLGSTQGIMKYECAGDEDFNGKLFDLPVLQNMSVTSEQKRASKLVIGSIIALAVIIAAALIIINPFARYSGIAPDSTLGKLGLSGDPLAVTDVYVYGEELRDRYLITAETSSDENTPEVLFIESGDTTPYGSLSDVSDFTQLENLKSLCITGNQIESLEPLYSLTGLTLLDVSKNGELDISGIGALPELETLSIAFNTVTGLDALLSLAKLKTLYASRSQQSLLEALGAVGFEIIYIDDIDDIDVNSPDTTPPESESPEPETISPDSILGRLGLTGETDKITELYIYGDKLQSGFHPANSLRVAIDGCGVAFLDSDECYAVTEYTGLEAEVAALVGLEELSLAGTGIGDLSALSVLDKLTLLDISQNKTFSGLSDLEKLPALETLNIANTDIEDYTALKNLKALKTLYVDETQYRCDKDFFDSLGCEVISVDARAESYEELKAELAGNAHFRIFAVGSIVIPEGETLVISGKAGVFLWGEWDDTTLINNGTLEIYGEYMWCQNVKLENNGTLILRDSSIIALGRAELYNTGTFTVEKGAAFPVMMGSSFEMSDGTLLLDGNTGISEGGRFIWSGGNITNNGTITVDTSTGGALELGEGEKSGCEFVNNGTINLESSAAEEE